MTPCAFEVEKHNHHREWNIHYNTPEIYMMTHGAGNKVTEKDHALDQIIDTNYDSMK